MSKDEAAKPAEGGAEPKKKSKLGLIAGIGGVVVIGVFAGGLFLGPKLMGSPDAAHAAPSASAAASHAGPAAEPTKVVSMELEPIIVDIRGKRGELHHLKVGLAAELRDNVTVEELKLVTPRAREAALSYLRPLTLDEVTDPKEYKRIREELSEQVMEGLGKDRVHRILLVDFIAQ